MLDEIRNGVAYSNFSEDKKKAWDTMSLYLSKIKANDSMISVSFVSFCLGNGDLTHI